MPRRILSLEMTGHDLKATVVEVGFRDYTVEGFHHQPLTIDGGTPAQQLNRFVAEIGGDVDTVVYALPPECVTWRMLTLPFRDQRKLAQTIPFELESSVPFALDDVIVDYKILHRDRAGTTVLAALAPKAEVEHHLETLREANVDPKIVDAAPLAILNALTLVPKLPRTFAFVDFGDRGSTVALYRDGVLSGVRALHGLRQGAASNGNAAAAPVEEETATVSEVRWTLLALNGAPLEEDLPCFVGGVSERVDRLAAPLGEALGLRVERLDRLALVNMTADLRQRAPGFTSSLGAALREVAPGESIGVNFRRGEFAFHRSEEELRRGLRVVAALALLVVALTVGDLYAEYRAARVRLASIEQQIYGVFDATVDGGGKVAMPVATLQEEIDLVNEDVQMLDSVVPVSNSTSVDILRAVSAAVPTKVRIDSDEYVMDPDSVRLMANTETFEFVDVIKQHLLETGFFSDVQVKDAVQAKRGTGVDFRMTMMLNKNFRPPVGR